MRSKNIKKLMMAGILAAAVTVSAVCPPVAGCGANVLAAQKAAGQYVQINNRSARMTMSGDAAAVTVESTSGGLFRTSIVNGDKYIMASMDGDCLYTGVSGDQIEVLHKSDASSVVKGHIYEIRYTRNGSSYTISFYDVTADREVWLFNAQNTTLTEENVEVYVKAQGGECIVYNCSAADAGFSKGDVSANTVQEFHGRDRSRRVSEPDNTVPQPGTAADQYDVNEATQGKAKNGAYNKYFLKDDLQTVKINMSADNLDYVLQNAATKAQAMAESVTIGDQTVKYAALKTKGNFTRNSTNASDSDRFSFTVNFSKFIKKKKGYSDTQNFFGCEKISFNNFYFDKSMLKEYNALRLMTEMGVPTPQYGLAKLYINDEYYGVYFMVEPIQKSILKQYFAAVGNEDTVSDYYVKPDYYSPRFYSDLSPALTADREITWDSLVQSGLIRENADGTCGRDVRLNAYAGLWENDEETFQDAAKELPNVLTWMYRLTMLSNGKDFSGNAIDVNSDTYLNLLDQVMDVEETLRYFAAHSFIVQMDNLFSWRQNYALYVDGNKKAMVTPWDYDLAWGCDVEPNNGESVANWDIDRLYSNITGGAHYYTADKAAFYRGSVSPDYEGDTAFNWNTGYPLFNVFYQNQALMKKFHTYIADCSKLVSLGGTTSFGKKAEPGSFGSRIDQLKDKVIKAASEPLGKNIYYLNGISQPQGVKAGAAAMKQMLSMRSAGAWLQVQGIDAGVTGYGYATGALGNDAVSASYTTGGKNVAAADDETGIFTIADYLTSGAGPQLTAQKLSAEDKIAQAVSALVEKKVEGEKKITVYHLKSTKASVSDYRVFIPTASENTAFGFYYSDKDKMARLEKAASYDGTTAEVRAKDMGYFVMVQGENASDLTGDIEEITPVRPKENDNGSTDNGEKAVIPDQPNPNAITGGKNTVLVNASAKKQKVKLGLKPKYGVIAYTASGKKVKVSKNGVVTLPAGFSGSVKITAKVRAAEDYQSAARTVTIKVPGAAKIRQVKKQGKGKLKIRWKKISGVSGYQIRYSQKKNMAKSKKVICAGTGKTKTVLRGLKSKKTYYVQIRTYIGKASERVYGVWSGSMHQKTK